MDSVSFALTLPYFTSHPQKDNEDEVFFSKLSLILNFVEKHYDQHKLCKIPPVKPFSLLSDIGNPLISKEH